MKIEVGFRWLLKVVRRGCLVCLFLVFLDFVEILSLSRFLCGFLSRFLCRFLSLSVVLKDLWRGVGRPLLVKAGLKQKKKKEKKQKKRPWKKVERLKWEYLTVPVPEERLKVEWN